MSRFVYCDNANSAAVIIQTCRVPDPRLLFTRIQSWGLRICSEDRLTPKLHTSLRYSDLGPTTDSRSYKRAELHMLGGAWQNRGVSRLVELKFTFPTWFDIGSSLQTGAWSACPSDRRLHRTNKNIGFIWLIRINTVKNVKKKRPCIHMTYHFIVSISHQMASLRCAQNWASEHEIYK